MEAVWVAPSACETSAAVCLWFKLIFVETWSRKFSDLQYYFSLALKYRAVFIYMLYCPTSATSLCKGLKELVRLTAGRKVGEEL